MATISIGHAIYLGNPDGQTLYEGGAERTGIKETASQTYGQGAPLYKDSSGTIAIATASSNVVALCTGFAMEAASGTTGQSVYYRRLRPGDKYVVNVAGTSTTTTNANMVGDLTNFDISSGKLVANPDGTDDTKLAAIIVALYVPTTFGYNEAADAAGDTNGRIVVQFIDNKAIQR